MKEIRDKTNISFSYKSSLIPPDINSSISKKDISVEDALNYLFSDLNLKYKLINDQIILYKPQGAVSILKESSKNEISKTQLSHTNKKEKIYDTIVKIVHDTTITIEHDTIIHHDTIRYVDTLKYYDTVHVAIHDKEEKRYALTFKIGSALTLNQNFISNSPSYSNITDSLNINARSKFQNTYGVDFSFLSDKINIILGIRYTKQRHKIDYHTTYYQSDSSATYNYFDKTEQYTDTIASYTRDGVTSSIIENKERNITDSSLHYSYDSTLRYTPHSESYSITYISIPICIGYNLELNNKLRVGLNTGIVMNFLTQNNIPINIPYFKPQNYSDFYFGFIADISMQYNLTNNWWIIFSSEYQQNITSPIQDSNFKLNESACKLGCYLGIKYLF